MGAKHRAASVAWALGLALAMLTSVPAGAMIAGGERSAYVERGEASYYGPGLHGRKMAGGKRFDRHKLTAAHRKLPLGSKVTVTNLENGKRVEVEVSDRGPYAKNRAIDLSEAAAMQIGITPKDGTAPVLIVASAR